MGELAELADFTWQLGELVAVEFELGQSPQFADFRRRFREPISNHRHLCESTVSPPSKLSHSGS